MEVGLTTFDMVVEVVAEGYQVEDGRLSLRYWCPVALEKYCSRISN